MRFALACAVACLVLRCDAQQKVTKNPTPIDFSFAGYGGGGVAIPFIPGVIEVRPSGAGDDTALLQSAINHVAALPERQSGFRGAVLLGSGRFQVRGQLRIVASGVVLRGSGVERTTVVATGQGRRTLIEAGAKAAAQLGVPVKIRDEHVEAGARTLGLTDVVGLRVGMHVQVRRPSTAAWIKAHGMSGLLGTFADSRVDWKPGSHDLVWDRVVTRVDAAKKQVEIDAPITLLIDAVDGGTVTPVSSELPIEHVGVENLTLESAFDAQYPHDEEHAWMAVSLDRVEDAWVRNVVARHFVSSAVFVGHHARRVTVQDSRSEAPVSEEGGYRRQSFLVYGQQVLVHRCHSEVGMNDFATGMLAAGPNVFLDDEASGSLESSGSFEGLAAGVLYENVRVPDSKIQLLLDQTRAQGAGWTAVNSVIWNSQAKSLDALGPYDGYNYVVESKQPLYTTLLAARGLRVRRESVLPTMEHSPTSRIPIVNDDVIEPYHRFEISNGRFVVDGLIAYGGTENEAWWHGNTSYEMSGALSGSSTTRFMPGQTAPGLTEDLHELAARAKKHGDVFYNMIPGLWYDHRRDEHTVFRQQNGDVWAPFFEMPWARSGKGTGWDGLSRFDLSRFNPWYFERQRDFARIAGEQGLIVYYNLYNTHDVLEIGPHWIDYPWRPANNINDTSLPEPPPFKGGHTLAMDTVQPTVTKMNVGNEFYNVDYPPQRKLHQDFIFHVLDKLGDRPNVIFTLAYQYAGPLAFQQFFQDTVAEWEKLHNKHVRLALVTSKGITDAIMTDPVRSKQISVIDMRYWYYLPDGSLFAPEAGQNRAFRDMIAERFGDETKYTNAGPPTTEEMLYKQVREYRDRYPEVALVASENGAGSLPIVMAGGAAPSSMRSTQTRGDAEPTADGVVSDVVHRSFARELVDMSPNDQLVEDHQRNWALANPDQHSVLIYSRSGDAVQFSGAWRKRSYEAQWVSPKTGEKQAASLNAAGEIRKPDSGAWLLLLTAQK